MTYEIAAYRPEHRDDVIRLRRRAFGGSRRQNEAHFRWKYEANPYTEAPLLYVALDGQTVVGMRGMVGGQWLLPGGTEAEPVITAADTAIDPRHRGRYLFEQINSFAEADLRERGHRFVLNFSANRATALLSRRAGWKRAGRYAPWMRADSGLAVQSDAPALTGLRATLAKVGTRLRGIKQTRRVDAWERRRGAPGARSSLPIEAIARISQAADEAAVRQVRDEVYLRWRLDAPRRDYRRLLVGPDEAPHTFALLLVPRTGAPLRIVDWGTTAEGGWDALLDLLPDPGVADLEIWTAGLSRQQLSALGDRGFSAVATEDTRRHPASGVLYRSLRGDEELPDVEQWAIRMLDSDAF